MHWLLNYKNRPLLLSTTINLLYIKAIPGRHHGWGPGCFFKLIIVERGLVASL